MIIKEKVLKVIASLEGKTMGGVVTELIEEYIDKKKEKIKELSDKENLIEIMKISETSLFA